MPGNPAAEKTQRIGKMYPKGNSDESPERAARASHTQKTTWMTLRATMEPAATRTARGSLVIAEVIAENVQQVRIGIKKHTKKNRKRELTLRFLFA